MNRIPTTAVNPFALLMDPEAVFRAIERSERLERLHSRICRPLDKPPRFDQFQAPRSPRAW